MSFVDSRVINQRMAAKDARMARALKRRLDSRGTLDQGRGRDVDASVSAPSHNSDRSAAMVDDQSSVGRPACTANTEQRDTVGTVPKWTDTEINAVISSLAGHAHVYPHWATMDGKAIAVIQHLRAENERLSKAANERQSLIDYHSDCRPNRMEAQRAMADTKATNDRWADEVAAHRATREAVEHLRVDLTLGATQQESDLYRQGCASMARAALQRMVDHGLIAPPPPQEPRP